MVVPGVGKAALPSSWRHPSPTRAISFCGKRGVQAQPLLAASAAPRLLESPPRRRGRLRPSSPPPPSLSPGCARPSAPSSIPILPAYPARDRNRNPSPLRGTGAVGRPRPNWEAAAATVAAVGTEIRGPVAALRLDPAREVCASAPPAQARGALPCRGLEEVRASLGRAAGLLLERLGRENHSHCTLLPCLLSCCPPEAARPPEQGGILGRPGSGQPRG